MMQTGRYEVNVTVQDCYFPMVTDTRGLRVLISVAGQMKEIRLATEAKTVVFGVATLRTNDVILVRVMNQVQDLGHTEIVLREQFPVHLAGEFDMWFKLTDSNPSPLSPERDRPFDSSPSRRIGRIRLKVTILDKPLDSPISPTNYTTEGDVIPEGLANCPRCSYLEKVLAALELEMEGKMEGVRWLEEAETGKGEGNEESAGEITPNLTLKVRSEEEVEIEHLKMVIVALNQKLASIQIEKSDLESLQSQLSDSTISKSRLQQASSDTISLLKSQLDSLKDALKQAQEENMQSRTGMQSVLAEVRDLQIRNNQLAGQLMVVSGELEGMKSRAKSVSELISQNEHLSKLLSQQESETDSLRLNLQRISQDCQSTTSEWTQEIESRGAEITRLRVENEELRHLIHTLKSELERVKSENLVLKTRVLNVEMEKKTLECQVEEGMKLREKQGEGRTSGLDLQKEIAKITENYQGKIDEFNKALSKMQQESLKARNLLSDSEGALKKLHAANEALMRENSALKVQNAEQRQNLVVLNEEKSNWQASNHRSNQHKEAFNRLRHDVDYLADSLLHAGERSLEANRLLPRLKAQLDERDSEIEVLRSMVSDYQRSKPVYTPVKDDPIDVAVASFVNENGHLPVTFCRQDEGLYLFGTKRVFIKLENGNIVIRVGGGYMRVEEFVEIYTPLELGKLAQTNEKQRLLRSNLLTRLASSSHLERREGRLAMSPQRASKLLKEFLEHGGDKFSTCFAVQRRSISPNKSLKPSGSSPLSD